MTTFLATGIPPRCGCGARTRASVPTISTGCGSCFCGASFLVHTFRFFKQTLGWTAPRLRSPEAADRWTWIVLVAYAQLRLARPLAEDLRRPWERPVPPTRLTPARVRRGFSRTRAKMPVPASAPKPSRPGPGLPPGSKTPTAHRITTWANAPKPKRENPSGPPAQVKNKFREDPVDER